MDYDSDKENKDPSSIEIIQHTPSSKKSRGKRKKQRNTLNSFHSAILYPLDLSEGSFVFVRDDNAWQPAKIMQITGPHNITCYRFNDQILSISSKNKLSSFMNFGCKVDFDLLEIDRKYQEGIVNCIHDFAEIHRPDLLNFPDQKTMLLDWARLGFIGCKLIKSYIPQVLVDYKDDEFYHAKKFCHDNELPSTSNASHSDNYSDIESPPRSEDKNDSEPCTPILSKRRKLSLKTSDSGYSSPNVLVNSTSMIDEILNTNQNIYSGTSSEIDTFVLGKLTRYGWWPGLIADPRNSPRPCHYNERLVYWFGDCTKSVVEVKDLLPISRFAEAYQPAKKGLYRIALYDFLSDAAQSCNYSDIEAPDSVNIDEKALSQLVLWALGGFTPNGPPTEWIPTDFYLKETNYRQGKQKLKPKQICKVDDKSSQCIACRKNISQHPHPLFEGYQLCQLCLDDFANCAFLFGEDGTGSYCSVCNQGGCLFICDESQCGRPYCPDCVEQLCGSETLQTVEKSDPWFCVLCSKSGILGALKRRNDWQEQLHSLLTRSIDGEFDIPPPPPIPSLSKRRPIRVLSLFDGISTGLVALNNIGFQIGKYIASEVDEEALRVTHVHHPEVLQIGDIEKLTPQQMKDLGPIDLVIGGSPCNDLSNVNPARRGIYEGTGRLFFEFYRILRYVKEQQPDYHVFWLFENVVSMSSADKSCISRFLQTNPVVLNAKNFSPMSRARYFWGNLPGMTREVYPLESDKLMLKDCLEQNCGRIARFEKINCITTKLTSVKQKRGRTLPVMIQGDESGPGDWLWCTEIERVFGLEPHYTDVANMSRHARQRLLGKAWSVPTLRHLFSPLRDYFKCSRVEK